MAASAASSSPTGSAGGQAHSNLYVRNIDDQVDDAGLRQIFEKFGAIKTACVMLDPTTKRSRNFGFVKFEARESAQEAVQELNNAELQGRKLLVKFADSDADQKSPAEATPSDNLYVKGLPASWTEENLHTLFMTYGSVTQLKILSRVGLGSTGEALVRMGDVEQAAWAIRQLHNKPLDGSSTPMLVRYADTPEDKTRRRNQGRKPQRFPFGQHGLGNGVYPPMMGMPLGPFMGGAVPTPGGMPPSLARPPAGLSDPCNLYVNELPDDADELFMYRTFAPYGAISSVRVMRDDNGVNRGFGFVKFVNAQEAFIAIGQVHGKVVQGKALHVSPKTTGSKNTSA